MREVAETLLKGRRGGAVKVNPAQDLPGGLVGGRTVYFGFRPERQDPEVRSVKIQDFS